MSKKILTLSLLLLFIIVLVLFGKPFTNKIVDGLSGGQAICENGLCSSCSINGSSCSCEGEICECGENVVDRQRCSLMRGIA